MHTNLRPGLLQATTQSVQGARQYLAAIRIERGDVVRVGRCVDLGLAVAIEIGDGEILVVHARTKTGFTDTTRGPA